MSKDKNSFKPIFYQNDDFQTIQIKVLFPFEETKEDLATITLLPAMVNYMNRKYPKEDLFQTAKKELYILSARCHQTVIGTTGCFIFDLIIPNADSLGENYYFEQIQFLREMIYEPLIIKNGFSSFELDREKKNLKVAIENSFHNMRSYQDIQIRKQMDTIGVLSRDIAWYPDSIDSVTPNSLYLYYCDHILQRRPIIYVMGNQKSREILSYCEELLIPENTSFLNVAKKFYYYLEPRETIHKIEENSEFKDSSLSFVYKVAHMSCSDRVYLLLVKDLLTSLSSGLLSKKLRIEKEFIYSSKVISYLRSGALEITAFIRKDDYEQVYQALLDLMNDLKNEKIIAPFLENIKERKRINLLRKLDDKYLLFDEFIIHDLKIDNTSEEYYELIKEVSAHELSLFINRLCLDTVYFLKEKSV